ncbi:MAG: hypothetical protein LUP97_00950, partial [Methanoregula sp.]|nr:hypothetical protein [Methanoregula sp.]
SLPVWQGSLSLLLRGGILIHGRIFRRRSGRNRKGRARTEAGVREADLWYSFTHCSSRDKEFHALCPACGRPFVRDYIDCRVHPRDPERTGTFFYDTVWARFWLFAVILAVVAPFILGWVFGAGLVLDLPF